MKKAFKNYHLLLFMLLGASISSCLKDPYTDNVNAEKSQIEAYVKTHYPEAKLLNDNGMYYISEVEGTGDSATYSSDYVNINYTAKFFDGTLFDTTDTLAASTAIANGYYPWMEKGGPLTFSMGSNFYGLIDGIVKMREGGKAILIIPSTLSFGDFKPRIYEVSLLKVYHNIAASRKLEFDSTFMVPMGFALKDSTTGGVFYKIGSDSLSKPGINYVKVGDTVAVKFSTMIMDSLKNNIPVGRTFEGYDSLKFIVGSSSSPYFYEALLKMKRGWTADVYVPFYNAYGSLTYLDSNTGQILAPPYSNLMYKRVEFLGFLKKINSTTYIIDQKRY
ncbi:MAG TPA: FKBP-type peptidyl-prolyl cis-trans isomerase [Bacteroidales bacterium]